MFLWNFPSHEKDAGHQSHRRVVNETAGCMSALLFVLVRSATADKVLPELQPFEGTVLRTSLSNEQEARLQQALQGVKPEVQA